MRRLFVLVASLSSFVTCTSWGDPFYDKQNGVWGSPGCAAGTFYQIATGDLYLNFIADNAGAWKVALQKPDAHRTGGQYLLEQFKNADGTYGVSYTWFDGADLATATSTSSSIEVDLNDLPDAPDEGLPVFRSQRCSQLPAKFYLWFAEGIRFMQLTAVLQSKCTTSGSDCLESVF